MHKHIFPRYEEFWDILKQAGKEVIFMVDGCVDAFVDDVHFRAVVALGADLVALPRGQWLERDAQLVLQPLRHLFDEGDLHHIVLVDLPDHRHPDRRRELLKHRLLVEERFRRWLFRSDSCR